MCKSFHPFSWKLLLPIAILTLLISAWPGLPTVLIADAATTGNTFFVAKNNPTGCNNNWPGSQAQPWCTIQKGVTSVHAGDTLYIKQGVYQEQVSISNSGSPNAPIIISGFASDEVIIDGYDTIPSGCYDFLVSVHSSYVRLQNLKVYNSHGGGIAVGGTASSLSNVEVYRTGETGVVLTGSNNLADHVIVHGNGNRYGVDCNTWGGALCTVGTNSVIQNSLSHDNVGEGLASYSGASGTIIQNNTSYNNAIGVYTDSTKNVIVRNNLIYWTADSSRRGNGIVIGHETSLNPSDITIANNIVQGGFLNLMTDSNITSLTNVTIAFNTFVNSKKTQSDINSGYNMSIYFRSSLQSFSNSSFLNNIVFEQDTRQTVISLPSPHPGFDFSHNLWSKSPPSSASSSSDVIGDPKFSNLNNLDFHLQNTSPAIDEGECLENISTDFDNHSRPMEGSCSLGALEYQH